MAFTFSTVTKLARKGALQQKLKSLFTYKVSSPPSLFQLKQALHQACWGAPTRGNESLRIVLLLLTASNYLLPHNAKDYKLYSLNSDMFGLVIPVTLDKWRQDLNLLETSNKNRPARKVARNRWPIVNRGERTLTRHKTITGFFSWGRNQGQ